MKYLSRKHEGNPYKVTAIHKDTKTGLVRITDGRGIRLMIECGYEIIEAKELKQDEPKW
jgi:hypothetical protein